MQTDGSRQEQITKDGYNDWFPHPSPDNNHLVFVTYYSDIEGHPANKNVMLRLIKMDKGEIKSEPETLVKLFGGQGTINVPSWSPDSKKFAYVSYKLL
jgi:Tol biopolymer transport system component